MLKRVLITAVFGLLPTVTFAASVHFGNYFLKGAEHVPDDIYIIGRAATLTGVISGDATAISGSVFSQSDISGDIFFLAEEVRVGGPVGDDARIVGGSVSIDTAVADDVVVIGSRVVIGSKAKVNGSLYVIGGSVDIDGVIEGDAKILAREMTLRGTVKGDLELWGDAAAFLEPASIGGDFIQHSKSSVKPPVKVVIAGKVIVDKIREDAIGAADAFLGGLLSLKALMMLALSFTLFFLARERTEDILLETTLHFSARVLRGLLVLIMLPFAAILLFPSVVGIPIALVLGALFLALLLLSWACAGILLGVWSERLLFKRSAFPLSYRPVLLGTLLLSVIALVPFLGPLFLGILMLATAGSIATIFMKFLRTRA